MSKSDKIFHSSAGTKTHGMYHPSSIARTIGVGAKDVLKRVGNVIAKPLNKAIKYEQDKDARIEKKRKSGEYLY